MIFSFFIFSLSALFRGVMCIPDASPPILEQNFVNAVREVPFDFLQNCSTNDILNSPSCTECTRNFDIAKAIIAKSVLREYLGENGTLPTAEEKNVMLTYARLVQPEIGDDFFDGKDGFEYNQTFSTAFVQKTLSMIFAPTPDDALCFDFEPLSREYAPSGKIPSSLPVNSLFSKFVKMRAQLMVEFGDHQFISLLQDLQAGAQLMAFLQRCTVGHLLGKDLHASSTP